MIHVLDIDHLGRPGVIAAILLETPEGFALFDTGPESTFKNVAAELSQRGLTTNDIRHVFLSHIHLDHAGAAWRFAESGATIYVHPKGATHLLDPRRLILSAARIFGDKMEQLWGKIAAVPAERLRVLHDKDEVKLGSLTVQAFDTPGHALHHNVYLWEDHLFGGDIAGVRLGNGPVIPPFVPPELDISAWLGSIQKMRELQVNKLYLPHFGLVTKLVASHFDELDERVRRWAAWFRERLHRAHDPSALAREFAYYEAEDLRESGAKEEQLPDYEAADPSYMAVSAALRYWQKRNAVAHSE